MEVGGWSAPGCLPGRALTEGGIELCMDGGFKGTKPCTEASQHPFAAKQGGGGRRHELGRERAAREPPAPQILDPQPLKPARLPARPGTRSSALPPCQQHQQSPGLSQLGNALFIIFTASEG